MNPINDIIKKIFGRISSLTGGNVGAAVGIDIGSSAIKVVEIKIKEGKIVLETYGSIALGPYDSLDVGRVTNLPVEKIDHYSDRSPQVYSIADYGSFTRLFHPAGERIFF
ncbi:MAG: hypothetical protein UU66_C0047G0006 [Parcubacteria group bacterium GW2011_GWB1_41_5]|nr:MAG: hypothetical protein UU66_C0047G0006 [Parcubacteria group bacterium GW2011_GWB1_41_5]